MPSERVQRRIDDLLDQAERALSDRDWSAVLESVRGVLSVDPQNEDALSFQSIATAALGEEDRPAGTAPTPTAEPSETPSSFAEGRYQVKQLLGEGGKKRVYLAHDTTLDRDVAFGLIKTEGLDDASRQRVTREAQAMGRLGDHPNIMPIHDLGEENGQPYMVQPLMGGGDVEDLIDDAEDGRLPLEDALRIASETCRGLEFAHSKGIIHRDLKPGNIWLTDDGTARIGDFGLALSLDRSRLTQEKVMVGTVSYMPPEQATGGEVTPRADLYSLGAMLYEMVTGRPPFMGDDDIAIIGQHINTPPVAPSWHNQSLPQTLDSLIMRLLSKDPAERPESAGEVLQALEAIDPAETSSHEEDEGSLDSMSGGVFVGRHREMDQLKSVFEDTLGGHGKMVALVGEPGIGKTRTAQELGTYASMRGGQVLWGRCYEGGGAPPYWPWVQAIRSYVMDRDSETVRREMGSTASVIAEIVPDVKERLPDVQPPPQIDDPESARFRLFDSIATFLKSASSTQPITLMLEDLHWSDRPSLVLLEFVARELANSRLMIVGNYRDMELNRRHPLSITLGELSRERLFDRVLLRGLQKHDVRRFIEVAAGIDPPNALVDAVHTQTEGNPLFVTETVRLLIQEGDITSGSRAEGGTSSWEIRIPEGVREVIGRRLDRLSERCNEVLTTAAVIGRQFRFGVLINLIEDSSENMLLDVLDEAIDARIIEEVPSDLGLYQFTHALMQDTLTSELSANRTVRLHARIAEALEDLYGDDLEEHAEEVIEHFAEAEILLGSKKLTRLLAVAGAHASADLAFDDSRSYFERAKAASDSSDLDLDAEITLGLGRAQALTLLRSELQIAVDNLTQAFDYYADTGRSEMAIDVALSHFPKTHGPAGVADLLTKASNIATNNSADQALLLARSGIWHSFEYGDTETALEVIGKAKRIAEELSDDGLLMECIAVNTTVLGMALRNGEAIIEAEGGVALAQASQTSFTEHLMWGMRDSGAQYMMCVWRLEEAKRWTERAIELAETLRSPIYSSFSRSIMASCHALIGDWPKAMQESDQALEHYVDARAFLPRVLVAYETGDFELGRESVDGLLDNMLVRGPPPFVIAYADRLIGDFSRTLELETEIKDSLASDSIELFPLMMNVGALILLAENRADADDAARLYALLKPYYSGIFQSYLHASGDRMLGIAAKTAGDTAGAISHYSTAVDLCRSAGYRVELAWALDEKSEMLLERDNPGDRDKATELQDEAIAIAQELGMRPLLERVLAQREILKA